MSGLALLKGLSILLAIAGGGAAMLAFYRSRHGPKNAAQDKSIQVTYYVSYIAMSLSVFALALHGLLN